MDAGWAMTAELMTAIATWMGIGWLVDRWLGISPWALVVGAMLGLALGTYLVSLRAAQQDGAQDRARQDRARQDRAYEEQRETAAHQPVERGPDRP